MFEPEVAAEIPEFCARKAQQKARLEAWAAANGFEGLQFARAGEQGTQYMVTCSTFDGQFYESAVYGQLPQRVQEAYGNPNRPRYRSVPEDKKPLTHRRFDLTDAELDQVMARWAARQSALSLPFLTFVVGPGNKVHLKQ